MSPAERKQARENIFPALKDKFLILNVNRNQGRKDVSRSLMIQKQLINMGVKDTFLYMHMQETDFGGSISQMARAIGLDPNNDYTVPDPRQFGAHSGFPIEFLNAIYNASDAYLTTTHGEGWGLSITEAMATKLPVIAPNNTSIPEILGEDRGWKINSGHTPSHWIIKDNDNERMRPLMDVEEAANTIKYIMDNRDEAAERAEKAYEWVLDHTWDKVCRDWVSIFKRAANKSKSANLLKNS